MKWIVTLLLVSGSMSGFCQDTLKKEDLGIASKLIDIQFSDSEMVMMYPDVKDNLKEYEKMHQLKLGNSIPMSLWQSPLLPGIDVNSKQDKIKWNIPKNVQLPANKNELAFYSIPQLASLIKNRKISSVELTSFFINRVKKFDDTLHCLISLTENIAMQQARQADEEIGKGNYRGPLHGVPYGLKDLFAVKGTKTTWGAAPYREQVIDEDAYVYTRLKEAGAVLIGKFTLGALAMGDYWYGGRTRNPWNPERGSSGSSAGSAAATVAGLVPFAIGTETYGSIVSPSHVCGATGLRPTFGRVSRSGAMTLSWSLDKIGPICRSAEDAAIVFWYIKGTDGKDASAVDYPFNYVGKTDIRKLKIAFIQNYFDKLDSSALERDVLKVFEKLGARLTPIIFADSLIYTFDLIGLVVAAESAAAFDEFTRFNVDDQMTRQNRFDWPNNFRVARFIPAVEYINANRHRYLLMKRMNEVMQQFDAVITPSFGGNQMAITNLTGHPVVCLPIGFNKQQLPQSISILGRLYDEATILAMAKAYQEATVTDEHHPPLFK